MVKLQSNWLQCSLTVIYLVFFRLSDNDVQIASVIIADPQSRKHANLIFVEFGNTGID